MIPAVVIRGNYQALALIVKSPDLSPALRKEILTVLKTATPLQLTFSNIFIGEQVFTSLALDNALPNNFQPDAGSAKKDSDSDRIIIPLPLKYRWFWGFLFNPHRSDERYIRYLNASVLLLQTRQMDAFRETTDAYFADLSSLRVKNPLGRTILKMTLPPFHRIGESLWKTEDLRLELLKRLEDESALVSNETRSNAN